MFSRRLASIATFRCFGPLLALGVYGSLSLPTMHAIEVHGYFTTRPESLARMLEFCDSPYLRLNLDTGNSFIAGQDPVAFCRQFVNKIRHVHIKDVSESLAAAARGEQTGIAVSQCAIGEGVNADNIRQVLEV